MCRPKTFAKIAGSVVFLVGITVLVGWKFDVKVLKTVSDGLVTMKANTAMGMTLCGLALVLLSRENVSTPHRFFTAALAASVIAMGALTLGEYFFGWNLGMDEMLFRAGSDSTRSSFPGRMSPSTAYCFVLAGSAVWVASQWVLPRWRLSVLSGLGATLIVLGMVAILGPILNGLLHFRFWNYFGMAVHTAAGFVLLGGGLVALVKSESRMPWALDKTTTVGFTLSIAIMLTTAGVSWNYTYELQDAASWVSHTHQVLKEIENVRAGMAELESSQRGYLILGDEDLLTHREQSRTQVQTGMDNLRWLTADNPHQKPRLDQLDPLIAQRTAFGEQTIGVRRQQGFPAAQQMLALGTGIALSAKIEQVLDAMEGEEETLLVLREKQAEAVSTATFLLLPVAMFLSLTILSLALSFLNAGANERTQAEEIAAQLAAIVNSSNDAIIGKNLNSVVTSWNPGAEKIFGYSSKEMIGCPITRLIPPDRQEEEQKIIEAIKHGESVEHFETLRVAKDGRIVDISVTVSPIKDKTGRIVGASKVARDITERRRAEDARRAIEARYRTLFDYAPNGIVIADPQSYYLDANACMCRMLGYSRDEMIRLHASDIVIPEELPRIGEALSTIKGRSDYQREWQFRRKDGSVFSAEVLATQMPDGNLLGVITDITERKRAEEALHESENQFRTMVNAIPQLAWIAHADGFIFWYNQRWFDYTGTTAEEMAGWGWQRVHDPDHLPKVMEGWKRAVASSQSFEMEFPLRAADGHYGWFLTRIIPLKDDAGQVLRWFGTNTDVSQKRETEEVIGRLNTSLEQRVTERTAELEAANKELEAFSYSVSHDLRAPLRAVDGFSQAVLEDYGAQLPPEGQHYLLTIRQGAQRMGTLIDDLLTFSRLSRAPLNKQTVNTDKLVRSVLEDLNSERQGRPIEIQLGELPPCEGDPALLKQVWTNLLSNAVKYTRQRNPAVIEIGCKLEQEKVYFVRDNGAGFDMRYVHKLFGVFQRLHRADQFEGTGVGLAIVQRIIHRHGGRIWVEAALDRGATFYFTLKEESKL